MVAEGSDIPSPRPFPSVRSTESGATVGDTGLAGLPSQEGSGAVPPPEMREILQWIEEALASLTWSPSPALCSDRPPQPILLHRWPPPAQGPAASGTHSPWPSAPLPTASRPLQPPAPPLSASVPAPLPQVTSTQPSGAPCRGSHRGIPVPTVDKHMGNVCQNNGQRGPKGTADASS